MLRCLERALKAAASVATVPDGIGALRLPLVEIWEKTWAKESLVVFLDVIKGVRSITIVAR